MEDIDFDRFLASEREGFEIYAANMLEGKDKEKLIEILNNDPFSDIENLDDFWNSSVWTSQQETETKNINETLTTKLEESAGRCSKCSSGNTILMKIQNRSGDEGNTFIIFCNACQGKTKLN